MHRPQAKQPLTIEMPHRPTGGVLARRRPRNEGQDRRLSQAPHQFGRVVLAQVWQIPRMDDLSRQYDELADEYRDGGVYNSHYERPAMLELLGDVDGLTILDAGCGSGLLSEELVSHGARVVGVDSSERMLELARARLGDAAELRVQDLQRPLDWASDGSFDIVASSLALHYIKEWRRTLSEFHRILRADGRLVFSTHHPFADFMNFERPNYFTVEPIGDTWSTSGARYDVTFWRRPLGRIVEDVVSTGFDIEHVVEPIPRELGVFSDEEQQRLTSQPWFMFLAARRRPG